MKKLMTILGAFFFASVVLTSCGGPSACDCAELGMEALKEGMENLGDETKQAELAEKWEKKLKPCEEASEGDEEFEKEVEKCMKDLLLK